MTSSQLARPLPVDASASYASGQNPTARAHSSVGTERKLAPAARRAVPPLLNPLFEGRTLMNNIASLHADPLRSFLAEAAQQRSAAFRPAPDLRHRRHGVPQTDLGPGMRTAGRDVQGRCRGRRARRAARLFPRGRHVPRLAFRQQCIRADEDHGRGLLLQRPYPDREGLAPRTA